MALLGSLQTGASGVRTHGKAMAVVGNNIANVNTFGFKRNEVAFEDVMGNEYPQGASFTQVTNGVKIGAVKQDFTQGTFENTSSHTDMAIGGNGFFTLINPDQARKFIAVMVNLLLTKRAFFQLNAECVYRQLKLTETPKKARDFLDP